MVTPGAPGVTCAVSGSRTRRVKPCRFTGLVPRFCTVKYSIPPPSSVVWTCSRVTLASLVLSSTCTAARSKSAWLNTGLGTYPSKRLVITYSSPLGASIAMNGVIPTPSCAAQRAVLARLQALLLVTDGPGVRDAVGEELDGRILGAQAHHGRVDLAVHGEALWIGERVLVQLVELDHEPGPPPVGFLEVGRHGLARVELEGLVLRALGLSGPHHGAASRGARWGRRLGTLGWRYRGLALVASTSREH